jgi:hypothetical protein
MGTLREYGEKNSELKMDCYKIKCSIQHSSEASTSDSTSSRQTIEQAEDKDKEVEFGQKQKEEMAVDQPHISLRQICKINSDKCFVVIYAS